jgi:hypothetical protein
MTSRKHLKNWAYFKGDGGDPLGLKLVFDQMAAPVLEIMNT